MKRILSLVMASMICLGLLIFVGPKTDVYADSAVTVTYDANGGTFEDGSTTNVVSHSAVDGSPVYYHSANFTDDGFMTSGYYSNTWYGSKEPETFSIPGASSLHIQMLFYGDKNDLYFVIPGEYTNRVSSNTNVSTLPTGSVKGSGNEGDHFTVKEFDVEGDTVSLTAFNCGYFFTISDTSVTDGEYQDAIPSTSGQTFVCWNTKADGSGTSYYGDSVPKTSMTLYARYLDENDLVSGVYRNVDWRITKDGNLIIGRANQEQTYSEAYGEITTSYVWPWCEYGNDLKSISFEGVVHGTGDMSDMFGGWYRYVETVDVHGFDTSNVTDMTYFFSGLGYEYTWETSGPHLTFLHLDEMDVSNVTSMERMFEEVSVTELDLSSWDVSSVETFSDMFLETARASMIDLSGWDTSSATNMYRMFCWCENLEDLRGYENFDTSNVTEMAAFFADCPKLTHIDVSKWDTGNVTDFEEMFVDCTGITELDVSHFNVYSGQYFDSMFDNCPNLKKIDTSHWVAPNVKSISWFVQGCSQIEELDLSGFDMTGAVNNSWGGISKMFDGCPNLKRVVLPDSYRFIPPNDRYGRTSILPTPSNEWPYKGKWVREDREYGPMTAEELQAQFNEELAGVWIWDKDPTEYSIEFVSEESAGSMIPVEADSMYDFKLPKNQFAKYGYAFDHWDDGNGHEYENMGTIPAKTYLTGDHVVLTAVWEKRDTSLNWNGNEAEFSIRGGEQAVLNNIPAGTSYQVYELTPDGWVLVQQENASGVIEALEESSAAFWNKYQPGVTTVQFSGLKNLDGHPASAGSFTFELYEGDTLVDTATTQDGGFIQFKVIEYDAAGNHTYTIREVDSGDDSIDYDTHEETVMVEVTDDGAGHLSSEVTYDDDGLVFSNTTRPGTLRITKNATNGTDANADDKFTIEIEFRNESGMPINDNVYWYI